MTKFLELNAEDVRSDALAEGTAQHTVPGSGCSKRTEAAAIQAGCRVMAVLKL